jgi:hypothetical protein
VEREKSGSVCLSPAAEKDLREMKRCYILLGRGAQGGFDEITDKTESFLMDRYL